MTIDWTKEVEARKDDLLEDLQNLLRINSERDDAQATPEAPFGPGPVAGLKHMLAYGERDGFTVKNVDNYAGHIEYGEGDETLGIFGHMDVVPAGDGWETDPYEPVIKDGKIYARGASDDKGPSMAAYYAMKIIKELGLPVSKKIRFVVGSDEESGWGDMDYYFQHEEAPDFGFSPDAEFPIINGEKGNVTIRLTFRGGNGAEYKLESFKSGLRENMVPGTADAVVTAASADEAASLAASFETFIKQEAKISGNAELSDKTVTFHVVGKGAHGASPQSGINAATFLATFLNDYSFAEGAYSFINTIAEFIHEDFYGEKLGVAFEDEKMGKLTMNAGIVNFDPENPENSLVTLNFRYPKGTSAEELQAKVQTTVGETVTATQGDRNQEPHYVPVDDPLVATLLQVYEDHTGEKGQEQIIGGGTYGRLLKRGVAYGAMFPGYTDTMHQANEFMELDDLFRAAAIYADAIYRLAK
ncbi:dipeptidase PepV [Enterococcus faecalis]|uniref:dipeptidase PepV n=1 Tax=Enterococcus faecalis TaxID=1351 RepID=UPI00032FDE26|nr:dipeptidase PepV [Enterococcus faecalis]EOJ78473.1 dipeptidase PepV [Enterococcus faecalis EnGen0355]PQD19151.1 dipeptidase PepV [Enterococcus faecalis]VFA74597.1 peptidase V. Metallo peptidase. MEROPS family M20A [Enterococcus faecalis]